MCIQPPALLLLIDLLLSREEGGLWGGLWLSACFVFFPFFFSLSYLFECTPTMRHCVIRCLIFLFIRSCEEHSVVVSVFPPLNQMGRKRSLLSVSCEQYFLQALDAKNLMRPPASNFSQFPQQHWKPLLSTQAGIENRILMNTRNNTYLKNSQSSLVYLSHYQIDCNIALIHVKSTFSFSRGICVCSEILTETTC